MLVLVNFSHLVPCFHLVDMAMVFPSLMAMGEAPFLICWPWALFIHLPCSRFWSLFVSSVCLCFQFPSDVDDGLFGCFDYMPRLVVGFWLLKILGNWLLMITDDCWRYSPPLFRSPFNLSLIAEFPLPYVSSH